MKFVSAPIDTARLMCYTLPENNSTVRKEDKNEENKDSRDP